MQLFSETMPAWAQGNSFNQSLFAKHWLYVMLHIVYGKSYAFVWAQACDAW